MFSMTLSLMPKFEKISSKTKELLSSWCPDKRYFLIIIHRCQLFDTDIVFNRNSKCCWLGNPAPKYCPLWRQRKVEKVFLLPGGGCKVCSQNKEFNLSCDNIFSGSWFRSKLKQSAILKSKASIIWMDSFIGGMLESESSESESEYRRPVNQQIINHRQWIESLEREYKLHTPIISSQKIDLFLH